MLILILVLFSGLLHWSFTAFQDRFGTSTASTAAFLLTVVLVLTLPGLPVDWFEQFRLEEKFGFNTTTPKTWLAAAEPQTNPLLLASVQRPDVLVLPNMKV